MSSYYEEEDYEGSSQLNSEESSVLEEGSGSRSQRKEKKGKKRGKTSARRQKYDPIQIGGHDGTGDGCTKYFKTMQRLGGMAISVFCCPCAICGCGPVTTVREGEQGILLSFGELSKILPPGLRTYPTLHCTLHTLHCIHMLHTCYSRSMWFD